MIKIGSLMQVNRLIKEAAICNKVLINEKVIPVYDWNGKKITGIVRFHSTKDGMVNLETILF